MLYTDWNSFRNWYDESGIGKVVVERGYKYEKREMSDPMEFSGKFLEDKTEIYEGDLIEAEYVETLHQWAGNTQKEVAREKMLFKVEKRDGCFRLTNWGYTVWFHELWGLDGSIKASTDYCSKHAYDFGKTCHCFTNFKKVGTVYENPELLENFN